MYNGYRYVASKWITGKIAIKRICDPVGLHDKCFFFQLE